MTDTYTNRREQEYVLETVEEYTSDTGEKYIQFEADHTGWAAAYNDALAQLKPGDTVFLETTGGAMVTGMYKPSDARFQGDVHWLFHKTDDDLAADHAKWAANWEKEKVERLKASRAEWAKREAELPAILRERLMRFRNASPNFEKEGWGYELIICELAVLYKANGVEEDDTINAYADREGTSGNQHQVARLMAKYWDDIPEIPAGMAPLTGSADYAGT